MQSITFSLDQGSLSALTYSEQFWSRYSSLGTQTWCLIKFFSSAYFKVVCMVNIKLFFYGLIYHNLITLIRLCKIPYKNLDKALLFLGNQVYCLKNFEELQLPHTLIVSAKTSHTFPSYQYPQKSVRDFLILFRSWVICKKLKRPVF